MMSQSSYPFAVGVDGGGSKTLAVVVGVEGNERGRGIVSKVYNEADKATIAALSALVFEAAGQGDEMACSRVEDAARELALVTVAVKNRLDFAGGQVAPALGGRMLLHETDFRVRVIEAIGARTPVGNVALVEEPTLSGARAVIKMGK